MHILWFLKLATSLASKVTWSAGILQPETGLALLEILRGDLQFWRLKSESTSQHSHVPTVSRDMGRLLFAFFDIFGWTAHTGTPSSSDMCDGKCLVLRRHLKCVACGSHLAPPFATLCGQKDPRAAKGNWKLTVPKIFMKMVNGHLNWFHGLRMRDRSCATPPRRSRMKSTLLSGWPPAIGH